jgi:hypothetical protein
LRSSLVKTLLGFSDVSFEIEEPFSNEGRGYSATRSKSKI